MSSSSGLIDTILELPIFQAEWVLWLLIGLSLVSVAIMIERFAFYRRHAVESDKVRLRLNGLLEHGDYDQAASYLQGFDSYETNVVLFGLREHRKGVGSVQDLLEGAEARERGRYSQRLGFLATVGSNAPFIGLFGTVLGVIRAFAQLSADVGNVSGGMMSGISEALVATGVGLMVAIPAVIAYNVFLAKVKGLSANTQLLSKTLLSQLRAEAGRGTGAIAEQEA